MSNILSRIFKGALGDILNKPKTDLGNLPTKEKVDKTRRGIIAGSVAAPVAGVLNELPFSKIIGDVAPVVKKVGKVLPKDAFNIPIFNQAMNKELADKILSGKMGDRLKKLGESDIDEAIMEIDTDQELKVMSDAYEWFRSGKKGDPPNNFAKLMDEEYSGADSGEIANLIGNSNQAGLENWQETQKLLEKGSED
jgi:hypothetical protein